MTYRVIQWATGAQGVESIAAILDSAELELVGAKVYSGAKEGVDAAVIAGREPCGVLATQDVASLLALKADCVAYMPLLTDLDEVCQILASGANVVTTAFAFHPAAWSTDDFEQLERACAQGGSSLHGAGLNPGILSGTLPLALTGMCRTVERVTLQERADWSFYESTQITFDNMRFGRPRDEVSEEASEFLAFNSGIFKEEVALLADALHAGIDEITTEVDFVDAREDHEVFGILLKAGTVSGQRWRWQGRRDGVVLVEIDALWTVGGEYPDHWPKPRDGWTLTIEGDPSVQTHTMVLASFEKPRSIVEHVRSASIATAMHAVNAIPALCDAAPGVQTMADLGLTRSLIGFGNR